MNKNQFDAKHIGFELLNENEMQIVRGGIEPTKPVSRPREVYDWEEEAAAMFEDKKDKPFKKIK
jgi:hypothetical protein